MVILTNPCPKEKTFKGCLDDNHALLIFFRMHASAVKILYKPLTNLESNQRFLVVLLCKTKEAQGFVQEKTQSRF